MNESKEQFYKEALLAAGKMFEAARTVVYSNSFTLSPAVEILEKQMNAYDKIIMDEVNAK